MRIRHAAKKAFIEADSSKRVAKAMLRKAAPRIGNYQVGDLISFQREQRNKNDKRSRWSPAARIIGFEGPKVCWAICEGVPFCLSLDRIRPANDAELLAYQFLHKELSPMPEGHQQSFVDQTECLEEPGSEGEAAEDRDSCYEPEDLDTGTEEPYEPATTRRRIHGIGSDLKPTKDSRADTSPTDQGQVPTESRGDPETRHLQREPESKIEQEIQQEKSDTYVIRERSRTPPKERAAKSSNEDTQDPVGEVTENDRQALMALQRDCLVFLADGRIALPAAKMFESHNEKKEKRGNTLCYEKESKEVREGLDVSRRDEWTKWKRFVAGRPCKGRELEKFLAEGHEPVPTRWVDVDKAAYKRRPGGPPIPPEYKSRFCGRGDLEGIEGLRTDSPTADVECHHLLFSFAASSKLELHTADISNAYFQGELLDRVLLLKPPNTGIPDPEYQDGQTLILARVPIYGTQDAGRKFWTIFQRIIQ